MGIEKVIERDNLKEKVIESYIPFGVRYLENPLPRGYPSNAVSAYTSVTFCTWKFVPLVDDGD